LYKTYRCQLILGYGSPTHSHMPLSKTTPDSDLLSCLRRYTFPLMQLILFNLLMWCCMGLFQERTLKNLQPTFTTAKVFLQLRKETSFYSSGLPGSPHSQGKMYSQVLRVLRSFLWILRLYLKGSPQQPQMNPRVQFQNSFQRSHCGKKSKLS
jgi:hypothetical protein